MGNRVSMMVNFFKKFFISVSTSSPSSHFSSTFPSPNPSIHSMGSQQSLPVTLREDKGPFSLHGVKQGISP